MKCLVFVSTSEQSRRCEITSGTKCLFLSLTEVWLPFLRGCKVNSGFGLISDEEVASMPSRKSVERIRTLLPLLISNPFISRLEITCRSMAESSSPEVPTPGQQQWSWSTDAGKKVPSSVVPERTSSKLRRKEGSAATSLPTETEFPLPPPPPPHGTPKRGSFIRSRGRSSSPLRRQNSYVTKAPLKTFVPEVLPTELLYEPLVTHSRILMDIRLCSPIFMGGATVEGEVHLVLDGGLLKHKQKSQRPVSVSKICVTVVGIERCRNKQAIFRALKVDLLNEIHPLPLNMIPQRVGDGSWTVQPSSSIVPFRLDLPVTMGPPPYRSKKVGIDYLVSITIEAGIGKKKFHVRQSKEIVILTVHDRK